jgi:predicted nucleic acid binding AN1-type Zn finger protein
MQKSDLTTRILRELHKRYQVGDVVSTRSIMEHLNHQYSSLLSTLRAIEGSGYIEQVEDTTNWLFKAKDRSMTCCVCSKYAPKQCPGCKGPFCEDCYEMHYCPCASRSGGLA